MKSLILAALALMGFSGLSEAACVSREMAGEHFLTCEFDAKSDRIALYNTDAQGKPYQAFRNLQQDLALRGETLLFAMNAGMFDERHLPIGLYIENGQQRRKLSRAKGGNFGMKPNGVFWITGGKAGVTETEAFAKSGIKPDFASQSGPMLVVNGEIHPKISPTGTSRKLRNGVCVTDDQKLEFVISENFVTFWQFATYFRDGLKCKNALFFDGSVSSVFSTDPPLNNQLVPVGPMVAVVK